MAARAECGERERLRFGVAFGSDLVGKVSSLIGEAAEDDEDVLVFDVEGFFDEAPSSVALESVDLDESEALIEGTWSFLGFEVLESLVAGAASESLLEEVSSEEEAGKGFLAGHSSDELLSDVEVSDDEDELGAAFLAGLIGLGFEAVTVGFVVEVGSLLEAAFFTDLTFDFFAGGTSLSGEDELESDSELEDWLEPALRLSLLMRPLTVGFEVGTLAPAASFSSSASLSELEVEDDPEDEAAFAGFFSAFEAVTIFLSSASPSELELDEDSEVPGVFADFLVTFGPVESFMLSKADSLSSLLVSLLPLLEVCSAFFLVALFAFGFFLDTFGC